MRKNLLFLLSVFLALPLAAQVQITGSAVQVGGSTASAGVSSAQGTSPIQVNGLSGTPASGDITIACPSCGQGNFQYNYTQQGTGQYVLVPFTSSVCGATTGGSSENTNGSYGPPLVLSSGGFFITGGQNGSCTFSNPVLPSGVTTGQITAIYAVGWKAETNFDNASPSEVEHLSFSGTSIGGGAVLRNGSAGGMGPTPFQYGLQLTGTFANFGTITATAAGATNPFSGGGGLSYAAALEVDYTGTPVTQSGTVNLGPGFGWDPSTDTLSLLPFAIYPISVSAMKGLPAQAANTYNLVIDGASSADCATGGGSNTVWCKADGAGGFTGFPFGGSAINQLTGDATAGPGSGSQALTLATVNSGPGACGDATHVCQVTTNGKGLVVAQTPVSITTGSGLLSLNSLTGPNLTLGSSDSSVLINPSGTNIDLRTVTSANGVQFNPTTTNYIFLSFSGLYDDGHALSSAVPVTSASCVGSSAPYTCTVVTTSAHNLSVGSYVDVATITGWLSSGVVTPFNGSFQIISTGFTTTQFEFLSSLGTFTCSSSCGNVYDASYWGIYQTANQPFLKGHGTVYGVESDVASADTNFSTALAPLCSLSPGPNYLIIEAGQNDLDAGANYATIIGHLAGTGANTGIWYKAHAAGCTILQGSIVPGSYGSGLNNGLIAANMELNEQLPTFAKSFANLASGQYFDRFIDYNSYMMYTAADGALGNLGTVSWQAHQFAQRTNMAFADQQDSTVGPFPFLGMGGGPGAGGYTWDLAGTSWGFINTNGDSSGNQWMGWNGDLYLYYQNQNGGAPILQLTTPFLSTNSDFCSQSLGYSVATSNSYALCFKYISSGSNSNYLHFNPYGGTDAMRWYADGSVSLPNIATSPSTSPICPNGTNGTLTTSGCSGGGSGLNGTVTYTSSQTAASGDNGKLVIMNCSGACAYTLPATQPSTTWQIALQSVGSTTATLGLSGDTYNGGATAPVLVNYDSLPIWANTVTSTDYRGGTPLVAGSNVSVTPATNGKTIASTGGGSGPSSIAAGTNVTITEGSPCTTGTCTINASGGGGGKPVYTIADVPPGSANAMDDEFTEGSLPGKWTSVLTNSGTFTLFNSQYLQGQAPSSGTQAVSALYQTAPATPWTVTLAMAVLSTDNNYLSGGLVIRDSGTGKIVGCTGYNITQGIRLDNWTNPTTFGANAGSITYSNGTQSAHLLYLSFQDDGTNLNCSYSYSGIAGTFVTVASEARTSFLANPNQVGIGMLGQSSIVAAPVFQWFRRTQ